jgi:hypothetical protein
MPTSADLGSSVIASFVLSADGITGHATELIEAINTRKSNNHTEGNYDYTTLEEMQIFPTGGDTQNTSFQASSATWLRSSKTKSSRPNKTMAAFALLTQPTAIQQCTFDLLGVPPRLAWAESKL